MRRRIRICYSQTFRHKIPYSLDLVEPQPYKLKLDILQQLIASEENVTNEEVIRQLGNGIAALYSVPTAIFCFLRAQRPIKGIETENPLRRAIQYAVS